MGFGLPLGQVITIASEGFFLTLATISLALILGLALGKLFKLNSNTSLLISGGTAICGGSAIAALAPTIKAKPSELIMAVTVVFVLNGIALLVYPLIGSALSLSQKAFGLWAALGIHDTSSVVGAASVYGREALQIATTTKLARALWIIPLVVVVGFVSQRSSRSIRPPLFILLFILACFSTSFAGPMQVMFDVAAHVAPVGLNISLFLIGAGFSRALLSELELQVFLQALTLWLLVSISSLGLITWLGY